MKFHGLFILALAATVPGVTYGFVGCPTNEFKVWGKSCYYFHSTSGISFDEAERDCESKGGGSKLASIHSNEENQYIFDTLNPKSNWDWWIGLKKDGKDKEFYWVDGTEVDYKNWAPGEPNDRDGSENCVEMWKNAHPGKWNDADCKKRAVGYACKANQVETWKEYNGNEYYFTTNIGGGDSNSWYGGRKFCQFRGGDLLSIQDDSERNQINQWLGTSDYDGPIWFGLNKLDGQGWKWSDGTNVRQTKWAPNYPRFDEFGKFCGYFDSKDEQGSWKNSHCDNRNKAFICKRRKGATNPVTDPPPPEVGGYCPRGYLPAGGNKCLRMVKGAPDEGLMFRDAVNECRRGPGFMPDIASIHNAKETALITSELQDYKSYGYWTGLYRNPSAGSSWRWADSSPVDYTNWASGEPSGSVDHCSEVWILPGPPGTWNNIDCNSQRGYICQTFKDPRNINPIPERTSPNDCRNGYIPYWGSCYKFYEPRMTWDDARSTCQRDGAQLVSVHSDAENAAVNYLIQDSQQGSVWMGLNDVEGSGEYKWTDGWLVRFTKWGHSQPKRESGGGCVRMTRDSKWEDTICTLQYGVVCKTTTKPPVTPPMVKDGICPVGMRWEEFHESCYYFESKDHKTWLDATQDCLSKADTATLVSIHTLEENDWLYQKLAEKGSGNTWTGLARSRRDKKFYWADFSTLQFENWAPGEPNGEDGDENCVEYYTRGHKKMWNDIKCTERKNFVCKAPKLPAEPTPAPVDGYCLDGWVERGQVCYYFQPNRLTTWNLAMEDCTAKSNGRGGLASVNNRAEDIYIYSKMQELTDIPVNKNYWLGLVKKDKDAEYKWTDGGKLIYANWAPGEPNDKTGTQNCVEVYVDSGLWNDHKCSEFHAYVCKMRKVPRGGYADEGLSGGSVAGITLGVIIALIVLVSIILFVLFKMAVIGNPVEKVKSGFTNPFYRQNDDSTA